MRRSLLVTISAFLFASLVPTIAAAQEGRVRFEEIERGFYVQGMLGTAVYVVSPGQGGDRPVVGGMAMGVAAGFDVLDVLQVEGFLSGAQVRAPSDYGGHGAPGDPHGDFSTLLGGAKARFAYLSMPDSQGIHRLHLTVHGGAGVLLSRPSSVMASARPTVLGGGGLHYFTRLRHFTIGAEVDAFLGLGAGAVALQPLIRLSYTF